MYWEWWGCSSVLKKKTLRYISVKLLKTCFKYSDLWNLESITKCFYFVPVMNDRNVSWLNCLDCLSRLHKVCQLSARRLLKIITDPQKFEVMTLNTSKGLKEDWAKQIYFSMIEPLQYAEATFYPLFGFFLQISCPKILISFCLVSWFCLKCKTCSLTCLYQQRYFTKVYYR